VLLFAAFASILAPVPPARPQARATVRIVRAAKAAQDEWERLPPSQRRETIVVDGGRRLKVRLIEME
jgi:acyl-CoA reductase-like NAD-dependent aldehyde dehydrogenase